MAAALSEQLIPRARSFGAFLVFLARRFLADGCLESAATLAYTTLLSLVPLLTVIFSVLSAFPIFDVLSDRLRDVLLSNLVPSSGLAVQGYLERFVDRAAGLTALAGAGTIVSALLMISAIDRALNRIWHVRRQRRPIQGFMVYWTVLTLSPLLLGASMAASSYLLTAAEFMDDSGPGPGAALILSALTFVGELLVFVFLYCAVPNRRVLVRHAAVGAAVAAVLFELAKVGFGEYVKAVPTFEAIYGTLAAVPLFLIWLYVCWVIVLLGAEVTQAQSGYRSERAGSLAGEPWRLVAAVRVLGQLWRAQEHGRTMTVRRLARLEPRVGERAVQVLLEQLEGKRVVQRTSSGRWLMSWSPETITLLDLFRLLQAPLPLDRAGLDPNDPWDKALDDCLAHMQHSLAKAFSPSLASIFGGAHGAIATQKEDR